MNYQVMKDHGRNSGILVVKEANVKRLRDSNYMTFWER